MGVRSAAPVNREKPYLCQLFQVLHACAGSISHTPHRACDRWSRPPIPSAGGCDLCAQPIPAPFTPRVVRINQHDACESTLETLHGDSKGILINFHLAHHHSPASRTVPHSSVLSNCFLTLKIYLFRVLSSPFCLSRRNLVNASRLITPGYGVVSPPSDPIT